MGAMAGTMHRIPHAVKVKGAGHRAQPLDIIVAEARQTPVAHTRLSTYKTITGLSQACKLE